MNEKETAVRLPMEHLRFLDSCRSLELKCAELYHHFEKLFAGDEAFSKLWQKTAHEEENHARQFELAVKLHGVEMERVKIDVSKAMGDLRKLEKLLEGIMASRPDSETALRLAIRLEEQLAALHMSTVVIFQSPEMKRLFDAMMNSDKGHVSMLLDALQALKKYLRKKAGAEHRMMFRHPAV